jgi:hypothetical protein
MTNTTTNTTTKAAATTKINASETARVQAVRDIVIGDNMTMTDMLAALNDKKYLSNHGFLKTKIDEKLKDDAKALKTLRMDALLKLTSDKKAFFTEFISNPEFTYQRLKENKKEGNFELSDTIGRISFDEIDTAYGKTNNGESLAQSLRYVGMTALYMHNMLDAFATDGENRDNITSKIVTIPSKQKDFPDVQADFSGTSKTALFNQLQTIVDTILPADFTVKMRKIDVRAMITVIASGKIVKGNTTSVKFKNEKIMLQAIFSAINHRLNDIPYNVESAAKIHKVKVSA